MINWKYFGKLHTQIYQLSGGRLGAKMGQLDVVLVSTVGRKSGQVRTAPIVCYPHKDSVVISASNSGQEQPPAWYLNMQANPKVTVQLGKDQFKAIADEVPDEERSRLWQKIVKINNHQGQYLEKVTRKIPLVWLRRV